MKCLVMYKQSSVRLTDTFSSENHRDQKAVVYLKWWGDFPGGAVVKNPHASAGDTGSSPALGESHMPRST